MKQLIQNYRSGKLELAEVPIPVCSPSTILVRNQASYISLGTERSIIELGQKSLLGKARARPDLVKRFTEKVKKEGLAKTFKEALDRLDSPTPLGYSSAGVVIETGSHIHKFAPGDRIACIGAGYASHAEYVLIPENLACKIPENLSSVEASSGMLGIIAMHGIRCAQCGAGETIAVIGLGLLGLLTVQILQAYGFKVIGMDIDAEKVKASLELGIDAAYSEEGKFRDAVDRLTGGNGADAVIIVASTKSAAPVNTAVDMAKYGGKIVVVGVADIHPQRNEMWHKEVEIIVSKAGGPGIFDPVYENQGIDYPHGYIRWTQNRNLEEYLRLLAAGMVNVKDLTSHQFDYKDAESVYANMLANKGGPYTGVVLNYPETEKIPVGSGPGKRTLTLPSRRKKSDINQHQELKIGVIGAGLFGRSLLLPALKNVDDIHFHTIATATSANSYHLGQKYGFANCTTDYREMLKNDDMHAVFILTPHSQHAQMVIDAINFNKHVFVEKPLCVNLKQLNQIIKAYADTGSRDHLNIQVGYNRRFSPHATRAAGYLRERHDPLVINYRVNAGFVPGDHWVHSEKEGGSRVIGEVCHFVDLIQYLCGCDPVRVYAERISGNNKTSLNSDNLAINLKFNDGSVGNIVYSASGDRAFSRERVEIFFEGKTIVIDDYRKMEFYSNGKKKTYKSMNQQMGYKEELQHFLDINRGLTEPLLTPEESFMSTLCVFKINESLEEGKPCRIIL